MAARYKVLDHLGAGGVGAVYKAYDTQLDRYVAIKRLLSREESERADQTASILKKEAASLATMQHPNIVSIFDLAGDDEGMFIVMELLEGDTLADWLDRKPMDLQDFREFASQSLEGILSAHQLNVLHRDLKPENIKMARLPGGRLQAKIVDFGLARMSYAARKQSEDQSGNVLGSIYYMAPEQFVRKPLDGRTDLYSIGCVFYQALSGQRPFQGRTVKDVIDAHLHHQVYDLKQLCPHLPEPICEWVMWMINAEPMYRPANAQAALDHLRALVDAGWFNVEVVAPPPAPASNGYQPQRPGTGGVHPPTGAQPAARTTTYTTRPVYRPPGSATSAVAAAAAEVPVAEAEVAPLQAGSKKNVTLIAIIAGVVVVAGGGWMLWSKASAKSTADTQPPNTPPRQPADVISEGAVTHYRAGLQTLGWPEPGDSAKEVQPGGSVQSWANLEPRGGELILQTIEHRKDVSPKYNFLKPDGFKTSIGMLQFDFGDGMSARLDNHKPQIKEYPFSDADHKGLTICLLVRPHVADKDIRIFQLCNQDDRGEIFVRATPQNEFHCYARVRGKDNKEQLTDGKVGRSTKGFSLVTVTWDGKGNRILMNVRSTDGGRSQTAFGAPKDCPVLNTLRFSDFSKDKDHPSRAEDKFAGDIVELAIWPRFMDWEPRAAQEQKIMAFYLTDPGSQFK